MPVDHGIKKIREQDMHTLKGISQMTHSTRTVTVRQLPETFDRNTERRFLRELEPAMNAERPAIVLDCSPLYEMNCLAIHLLLSCLEQAMKRNGDVRLAAVSPQAMENLRAMGVDRLFRNFDTNQLATESFRRRGAFVTFPAPAYSTTVASERAA